jgi:aristolochene synthase
LWFRSLLSALQRYTIKIHLTKEDLHIAAPVECNCAKHIAVLNDIYSWNKELLASETLHHEGAAICSSVQVLSEETAWIMPLLSGYCGPCVVSGSQFIENW